METLCLGENLRGTHLSQEPVIRLFIERSKHETKKWIEYIKDFDFIISYHPGKANVVTDSLSRQPLKIKVAIIIIEEYHLAELLVDMKISK